jgi:hypothetical protein
MIPFRHRRKLNRIISPGNISLSDKPDHPLGMIEIQSAVKPRPNHFGGLVQRQFKPDGFVPIIQAAESGGE